MSLFSKACNLACYREPVFGVIGVRTVSDPAFADDHLIDLAGGHRDGRRQAGTPQRATPGPRLLESDERRDSTLRRLG